MTVADVKARVQDILSRNFEVGLWGDRGFFVNHGSTRCFISVSGRGPEDPRVIVHVTSPIAFETPGSPALFEHVALNTDSWLFGHLSLEPDDDVPGTYGVLFVHRLLGNTLDEDELTGVVAAVAVTADDIDDDFVARFGGRRFRE